MIISYLHTHKYHDRGHRTDIELLKNKKQKKREKNHIPKEEEEKKKESLYNFLFLIFFCYINQSIDQSNNPEIP